LLSSSLLGTFVEDVASQLIGALKRLHPSEDGEALQRSATLDPQRKIAGDIAGVTDGPCWFAVYTTCRHEKRIAQHLTQRYIEHYLPLYRVDRRWRDGSRVTLELPLFPSYIFVRIRRSDRVSVLNVPGALAVVGGTGGEPAQLPDSAIESLRQGLMEHRIEPHPLLRVGQLARVRAGAFAGMQGIILRKKSGFRVVLTLEQIMQSIAVEVDEDDLEPVPEEKLAADYGRESARHLCLQQA
jgi:transcription antitermination factor NusG